MKRKSILGISVIALLAVGFFVWSKWLGTTRIAFVNFQTIEQGRISKANNNESIKLSEVSLDDLHRLADYDMVFINGMGLRIVEEQRQQIEKAASHGVPVYTAMATNPANNICSLDSVQQKYIRAYLSYGGNTNYRYLLNYVRKVIDGKVWGVSDIQEPVVRPSDLLYHAGLKNREEEQEFLTVDDYEHFLRTNGLYKESGKRIVVTGQMADASGLIEALEKEGYNVYPVQSMTRFLEFINEIRPQAVINMAHGRLGDEKVGYLKAHNILLFAPLTINGLTEEWEKDPMGMSGGFLSQSVVMPEMDGAIRTYALFAQYEDEEGLRHSYAVPERLKTFVENINKSLKLAEMPNKDKKIAIVYYKGPGQNALTAAGMEVVPSLYQLLVRLKEEGYNVGHLPADAEALGRMIQEQGSVFNAYAEGTMDRFLQQGDVVRINKEAYESWVKKSLRPEKYEEVKATFGEFPGDYMVTSEGELGLARLQFGNVVLMPQYAAGKGDNTFQVVHGTHLPPPHAYIASYLWMQYGFQADALIHFGTHGSLEFTPHKQVALCSNDWPDRLTGALPHFYIYSIGNVGEGMIAKRRSYATLQSYLTPPFLESSVRGIYRQLMEKIKIYNQSQKADKTAEAEAVKKLTLEMGIHRDLGLDSLTQSPYTEEEIARIENFAEELATEKITGQLYTMGVPYEQQRIASSVYAMTTEPIAYSLLALDKLQGKDTDRFMKHRSLFTQHYLTPARQLVEKLLAQPALATDELICRTAGITPEELASARQWEAERRAPKGMLAMMRTASKKKQGAGGKGHPSSRETAAGTKPTVNPQWALAVNEVERSIRHINDYREALLNSPQRELNSLLNALNGGYTEPTPGGDPIANPNTLPTGRNMYAINAEATPTESAWEKGVALAKQTIDTYKRRHNDSIPRKVSYTLWSSEFIETGGATIAQVLYMLGVEPVRDAFGRVSDLKLIPSAELGRPRIDVVVQTSGQLRDLAASRLFLIQRAVQMAAAAADDRYENQVAASTTEIEKILTEKGVSPKEARQLAAYRVFGGANGMYGTGIQEMTEAGDRWEKESEIAKVYLNNMGAFYGSEKEWETFREYAFEAALSRTDVVVQPRQSNTWGALSLDHVYEFMGGMNLAVRNVTGKDPDAYLSDYRNRNHMRMQEVKEAIGVESRTTILNPTYIREKMKGGASSADGFAEFITNTYGWNVMKPAAIDKQLWDNIYKVYVEDEFNLGVKEFFEKQNPAALEEMSAVMLESARKGLWKASEEQIGQLTQLHTALVSKYRPSCSGFVCNNSQLRQFIASHTDAQTAAQYKEQIIRIREAQATGKKKGMVMKKEEMNAAGEQQTHHISNVAVGCSVFVVLIALTLFIRKRRNSQLK